MTCLQPFEFEAFLAGRLDPSAAASVGQHLGECSDCQTHLEQLRREQNCAEDLRAAFGSLTADFGDGPRSIPINVSERADSFGDTPVGSFPVELEGFRIVREIHRGGQGVVFEAVQLSPRRTVAVKVMLGDGWAGGHARWRFEREVQLIASLRHPNIVVIHESGTANGHHYFAMDYVAGQPLDTHVRLAGLDIRAVGKLFKTICDAVAFAHRHGIIHRDLKPSNILVDKNGDPIVLDFGLARTVSSADLPALTMPGVLLGTVPYMAPEQTLGKPEGIDTRTDVYALAVILYELLVGAPPYKTAGLDLPKAFENIRNVDPPRPSKACKHANSEIDAIIMKAMEKEPARRYGSAGEMSEDLAAWLEGRPVQARSASSLYVLRKLVFKHSFETLVIFALCAAIGAFGLLAFQFELSRRKALGQKDQSDRATVTANADFSRLRAENTILNRHMSFGWFLLEWQAGRTARAAEFRKSLPSDSPEFIAMSFLLDDSMTAEQLFAQLQSEEHPLACFVTGERSYRRGEIERAIQEFERSVQTPGSIWIKEAARARVKQIQDSRSGISGQVPSSGAH